MKKRNLIVFYSCLLIFVYSILACGKLHKESKPITNNDKILSYAVDIKKQSLNFYLKNKEDSNYLSFAALKQDFEKQGKHMNFAMNGGMFKKDFSPQGLYIEDGSILSPIDTFKTKAGNFYLQPNGIFYISKDDEAFVVSTKNFEENNNIKHATQSGPLLLIDGNYHPAFREGSSNLHIRNGVGILPDGKLLFAMSNSKINFYDFATFFKENGCKNALYLDGFVSRTYLPSKGFHDLDGNFGVIIAEDSNTNN